jgi:hypothetical protein
MDGHHGHPGHHGHRSAHARVVACLSVKHHQLSLAPAPALTPAGQHHRPGIVRLCPALLSATLLRYLRTLSGFHYGIGQCLVHGRFEMMDAYSFGFGCCLLSVWFSFGLRLVIVWFSLVWSWSCSCLLAYFRLVLWLSARPDRCWMVWMMCSMLGLLAWFACLVRLDSFGGKEGSPIYIGAYDVHRPSFFTQQFTFV